MKGYFSERIRLREGVPQGDIICPYVFILAVETLLIKINYTKHIKGIVFPDMNPGVKHLQMTPLCLWKGKMNTLDIQ